MPSQAMLAAVSIALTAGCAVAGSTSSPCTDSHCSAASAAVTAVDLVGDWFTCNGEAGSECKQLDGFGMRLKDDGTWFYVEVIDKPNGQSFQLDPDEYYCDGTGFGAGVYTVDMDAVTTGGLIQGPVSEFFGDQMTIDDGSGFVQRYQRISPPRFSASHACM